MFEDIKKNKIKSILIIFIYTLVVTLILYYICTYVFELGYWAIIIALGFSISSCWASYYFSDKIILTINRARPATEEEDKQLVNIFDALMISSGLPYRPKLYIMESNQPNAFATGRNPEHSVICVTTALLNKLDYYEVESVIAHEMGHIKNYDILLSAVVSVLVGMVIMLSDLFGRIFLWAPRDRDDNSRSNGIMILISLILLALAAFFGQLIKLAISRKREYMADASSVEFTRNPEALISALEKISSDPDPLEQANNSTENMYFDSPFRGKQKKTTSIFSTHPSVEDRIEAIRHLK